MKTTVISVLLLVTTTLIFGQNSKPPDTVKHVAKQDTINPDKGNIKEQLKVIKDTKIKLHSDSTGPNTIANQPKKSSKIDTVMQNKYGDLLRDDSASNKKYSILIPSLEVIG